MEIAMQEVESSQIAAIGHHPETSTLAIRFKRFNGQPSSLYYYACFTAEQFRQFLAAESVGKHFAEFIKPEVEKHPYTQIEDAHGRPVVREAVA